MELQASQGQGDLEGHGSPPLLLQLLQVGGEALLGGEVQLLVGAVLQEEGHVPALPQKFLQEGEARLELVPLQEGPGDHGALGGDHAPLLQGGGVHRFPQPPAHLGQEGLLLLGEVQEADLVLHQAFGRAVEAPRHEAPLLEGVVEAL